MEKVSSEEIRGSKEAPPMEENLSSIEVDRNYLAGKASEVTQASFSKAEPNVLGSER